MDDLLRLAASRYGASPSALQPLNGGHYARVYAFPRDGRNCILRITPPSEETTPGSVAAVVHWAGYVAGRGGAVARPVASLRGSFIENLATAGGTHVAVAWERAPGAPAQELPAERWTDDLCRRLGAAVGRVHALSASYTPPPHLPPRPTWEDVGNCFRPLESLDASHDAVRERGREALERCRRLPKASNTYGLIHVDLHLGNVCVEPETGRLTLIDLDDVCYGWYLMDTAMLLFDAVVLHGAHDPDAFAGRFLRAYLSGYASERDPGADWLAHLPHLLKLLEYGVYTQVSPYAGVGGEEDPWVAAFMAGRRKRLERGTPFVSDEALRAAAGV